VKISAFLLLALGAILGVGLALFPTSVSVLGTSGTCGSPVLRVFETEAQSDDVYGFEQDVIDQCVYQSWTRLFIGGALGGIAWVVALIMFVNAPKPQPTYWGPPPPGWGPPPPQNPGY